MYKFNPYKIIIYLILFQHISFIGYIQAQSDLDPVVINFGSTQITHRQFDKQFETAMVFNALENGVPIKNQDQIYVLEHRYLQQRAKEMVLLEIARQQGITVSIMELDGYMDDFMQKLGFSGYSVKNMHKLGFQEELSFRAIMREKKTILLMISHIKNDLEHNDNAKTIEDKFLELIKQSGIQIFPENIDIPLTDLN
ncbi:MAG: hypothetical protein ACI9XC_000063 [Gammaproteobacteria bacterium]|jgi:hypothetical protein